MRQKWEYRTVLLPRAEDLPCSQDPLVTFLNGFGNEGWELCGVEYGSFIFKRTLG